VRRIRGAESWHQRQGTLSALRVLGVTCQGFLQLVSVVGALQQTSQRNDDVFKAWPLGHVLPPTVLKQIHKAYWAGPASACQQTHVCACVCNLSVYRNNGRGLEDT